MGQENNKQKEKYQRIFKLYISGKKYAYIIKYNIYTKREETEKHLRRL